MLLKLGMSGPDVLNLERTIKSLGFEGVPIDGVFDVKLENVIKYIQKSHNLAIDGKVGENTLTLIELLLKAKKPVSVSTAIKSEPVIEVTNILSKVHPILQRKVLRIIEFAKQESYNIVVTQGVRTFSEQHILFLKRPKVTNADAGQSYHNYGVAVDLAFRVNGKITWEDKYYKNIGRWASQVGLTWGGNWHFVDYPHVQLPNMPDVKSMKLTYFSNPINPVSSVWEKFVK